MNSIPRLIAAVAAYAAIALMATFTLDGSFRLVIWILMGMFAVKTLIAHKTRG